MTSPAQEALAHKREIDRLTAEIKRIKATEPEAPELEPLRALLREHLIQLDLEALLVHSPR